MIKNRIVLKSIAVFLAINTFISCIAPSVVLALTAGPTAPEATSFEPVDTTDAVDLKTGDFTYNIPLFELPGPGGNYPISLSHHANIQTNQEASWVGSSWTLNPGAITRFVNGYPDDHNGVTNVNRDFWEGGSTETYSVGISVGIANAATVTAGLSFANDTYRGRGIGGEISAGISNNLRTAGVGVRGGVSPYGQTYSSFYAHVGGSSSAQVALNSGSGLSAGASTGVSVYGISLLGASIQTDFSGGAQKSVQIGGASVYNSRQGKVSTHQNNFQLDIPISYYLSLHLSRNYVRYWIDESESVATYGALYGTNLTPGNTRAFDTYELLDTKLGTSYHDDAEKVVGGSFPDVDSYTVTGQGIGGLMKPMYYRKTVLRQDKTIDDDVIVKSYAMTSSTQTPYDFRFIGDFSNRVEYTAPGFTRTGAVLGHQLSGDLTTGPDEQSGYANNRLAGSRYIRSFTNQEIRTSTAQGFINTNTIGIDRQTDALIGGFSITNESGVTYHYALPAYTYDEIIRSQNTAEQVAKNGLYYNQLTKPEKYAYTWFLTAVTGPDFVDRNNNQLADDGDWGYWVRFDYTKHLGNYRWRNPGEGFNKDIDEFDFYSAGLKEIYYLDKMVTQSHVAVFTKSQRFDSREVADIHNGGFTADSRPCLKLDRIDIYENAQYPSGNTLRSMVFEYDYSLAPGTPNSFPDVSPTAKLGKLTLKELRFLGKNGANYIPPTKFDYKNVAYNSDKFDSWGYYKSDYVNTGNTNFDRLTTPLSAADADAWALTKIKTPLGADIKIKYESDRYQTPSLFKRNILSAQTATLNAVSHSIVVSFFSPPSNLQSVQSTLANSSFYFLFRRPIRAMQSPFCECDGERLSYSNFVGNYYDTKEVTLDPGKVVRVTSNAIEFIDNALYDYLSASTQSAVYTSSLCYSSTGSEISPAIEINSPVFVSGNLAYDANRNITYGGGTRVSEIRVENMNSSDATLFTYGNGSTTYEPIGIGRINRDYGNWPDATWKGERRRLKESKEAYNRLLYGELSELLNIARELPSPGVIYDEVTVDQKHISSDGTEAMTPSYTKYKFETFKEGMIGVLHDDENSVDVAGHYDGVDYNQIYTQRVTIKDYSSRIGNLTSMATYSRDGQLLSKTENSYLHDGHDADLNANIQQFEPALEAQFNNQGVMQETTVRGKIVKYDTQTKIPYGAAAGTYPESDVHHLLGVISKKELYPSILIGQKSTDYKTGITTESKNLAFDFYSGNVVKTQSTDGFGNTYVSETIPAYTLNDYRLGMGPKALTGGANMLVQEAASYVYQINPTNNQKLGLISANIQTWSNALPVLGIGQSLDQAAPQSVVWRKAASFSFIGNNAVRNGSGLYPLSSSQLPTFSAWDNSNNFTADWQKTSNIKLYDANSHAIGGEDLNALPAATIMSYDQRRVIATAANASYGEFGFSDAEARPAGGLFGSHVVQNSTVYAPAAHTGTKALSATNGQRGFTFTMTPKPRTYLVSVWSSQPASQIKYKLNNGAETASSVRAVGKAGDWYLIEADIPVTQAATLEVWCEANGSTTYFDDFRISPKDATMVSYVYNSWGELSYVLNDNNLFTKFEYDEMGRLSQQYTESFHYGVIQTSEHKYHYRHQPN